MRYTGNWATLNNGVKVNIVVEDSGVIRTVYWQHCGDVHKKAVLDMEGNIIERCGFSNQEMLYIFRYQLQYANKMQLMVERYTW